MKVSIIAMTEDPEGTISRAAGTSYAKRDAKFSRLRNCFERGHMSVFEHACVTFLVEGVSRACSHQLVRHRMASFVQESQRYVKLDVSGDWHEKPLGFDRSGELSGLFDAVMDASARAYEAALEAGVKPEDARYLLPEAAKTSVCATMNWREIYHFLNLRADSHAQWEIRALAEELAQGLSRDERTQRLIGLWLDKSPLPE